MKKKQTQKKKKKAPSSIPPFLTQPLHRHDHHRHPISIIHHTSFPSQIPFSFFHVRSAPTRTEVPTHPDATQTPRNPEQPPQEFQPNEQYCTKRVRVCFTRSLFRSQMCTAACVHVGKFGERVNWGADGGRVAASAARR